MRKLWLLGVVSPFALLMSEGAGGGAGAVDAPAVPPAGGGASGTGGTAAFADGLPEDIRTDPAFINVKSLEDLARGYHGFSKKFGLPQDRLLTMPAGDEDKAGYDALYKALGRPDAPDKYELRDPQTGTVDAELKTWFGTKAHELGLSNRQAAQLFDAWNVEQAGRGGKVAAAQQQRADASKAELQKEWGQAYEQKLGEAETALRHYGGDEFTAFLVETGLKDDPRAVRMLAKMGAQLSEDGIQGRAGTGGGALSPVEAQQRIRAQAADPAFQKLMRLPESDPARQAAMAEKKRLYQLGYPEEQRP